MRRFRRVSWPLTLVLVLACAAPAVAGFKDAFVDLMNAYYGNICTARLEGWGGKTLRVDWTGQTSKLLAMKIFAEVGDAKESLYEDGVRYFKFPNDAGGYNVIDWKTGEKKSIDERAPYFFSD